MADPSTTAEDLDPLAGKQRIIDRICLAELSGAPHEWTKERTMSAPVLGWYVSYDTRKVVLSSGVCLTCRRLLASWVGSRVGEDAFDTLDRLLATAGFEDEHGGDDVRSDEEGARPARRFIDWRTQDGERASDVLQAEGESALAVQMGTEEAAEVARREAVKQAHQDKVKGMGKWKSSSKKGKKL